MTQQITRAHLQAERERLATSAIICTGVPHRTYTQILDLALIGLAVRDKDTDMLAWVAHKVANSMVEPKPIRETKVIDWLSSRDINRAVLTALAAIMAYRSE